MDWASPLATVMAALVASMLGAGGTYLAVRRQHSGSVEMSDAATIFEASEDMRHELVAEVLRQRGRIELLEARIQAQGEQIQELRGRLARLGNHGG